MQYFGCVSSFIMTFSWNSLRCLNIFPVNLLNFLFTLVHFSKVKSTSHLIHLHMMVLCLLKTILFLLIVCVCVYVFNLSFTFIHETDPDLMISFSVSVFLFFLPFFSSLVWHADYKWCSKGVGVSKYFPPHFHFWKIFGHYQINSSWDF